VEEFGLAEPTDGVPMTGRTDRAIARDLFHQHGIDDTVANWEQLRAGYVARLGPALGRHRGRVLPGVEALLEKLSGVARSGDRATARGQLAGQGGAVVGLLTGNVREGARVKLSHYGIWKHFTFGGFGDEHLERDDVAREALAAVEQHVGRGVDPRTVWVIGDTTLDIACARTIGARALAVCTGWTAMEELEAAKPDLLIRDLSDPTPFLSLCE
jgi:phosphoglycolate phosphatase-like HAD superfamily hydrolase